VVETEELAVKMADQMDHRVAQVYLLQTQFLLKIMESSLVVAVVVVAQAAGMVPVAAAAVVLAEVLEAQADLEFVLTKAVTDTVETPAREVRKLRVVPVAPVELRRLEMVVCQPLPSQVTVELALAEGLLVLQVLKQRQECPVAVVAAVAAMALQVVPVEEILLAAVVRVKVELVELASMGPTLLLGVLLAKDMDPHITKLFFIHFIAHTNFMNILLNRQLFR
jgi:hypothetical protein